MMYVRALCLGSVLTLPFFLRASAAQPSVPIRSGFCKKRRDHVDTRVRVVIK